MPECSLSNIGTCVAESLFEFLVYLLNLPVRPLLYLIRDLLTEPVRIDLFFNLWATIVYILSMFYGIFIVFIGFKFIVSGNSPEEREKAKSGLSRILVMIVLVQASYILYELLIELISSISNVIYNQIPSSFFRITGGSIGNLGLEIALLVPYLITLIITLIFLTLRYIFVGIGVVFFAIGIFFYFLDSLNSYGRLILNYLIVLICLPVFYSIILIASSRFLEVSAFSNMRIMVMIGAFSLINLGTILILLFVIIKAASLASGSIKTVKSLTS